MVYPDLYVFDFYLHVFSESISSQSNSFLFPISIDSGDWSTHATGFIVGENKSRKKRNLAGVLV